MARYTDSRGQNRELKYLHRVWSQVDSRVELPPGLSGDALLNKLDAINHPAPMSRKIRFSPRIFTWRSGVTYAAAFVLIVALSSVIGRGNSVQAEILQGEVSVEGGSDAAYPAAAPAIQPRAVLPDTRGETAEKDTPPAAPDAPAQSTAEDSVMAATGAVEAEADLGIGGPGESVLLGDYDAYTYTYRPNDPTDPDVGEYPITLTAMDTATGELAVQINLPDMLTVEKFFVYENTLALVGLGVDGTVLRTYDITTMAEPSELVAFLEPGAYLDASLFQNVAHLLTFLPAGEQPECELIQLPDATGDSSCVITSLDLATQDVAQKAFQGASEDASLYNLNAYLPYEGESAEDNDTGLYTAQVRLSGMDIELGGIS